MSAAPTLALPVELDAAGEAAPPRSNGELVFAAPWESRAFGLAISLADAGVFTWDDFRVHLVTAIDDWTAAAPEGECWSYYERWVEALQATVVAAGVTTAEAVEQRTAELVARPAGYDHGHDHGDGHGHDHGHDHGHGHEH